MIVLCYTDGDHNKYIELSRVGAVLALPRWGRAMG